MPRPLPTSTLFPYTTLFRSKTSTATTKESQATEPNFIFRRQSSSFHAFVVTKNSPFRSNRRVVRPQPNRHIRVQSSQRSEEHTSELQSLRHLVCRLLLEKKK